MKTRAILQTSPFKTRDGADGDWRPYIFAKLKEGQIVRVSVEENANLAKGDTITVERHGSEWRAV
jgi:hypothetical protein